MSRGEGRGGPSRGRNSEPQRLRALHVSVPPAEVHGHDADAGLDQAAGQQHALGPVRRSAAVRGLRIERGHVAVPFAHLRRFLVEVEGVAGLRRGEHVPRPLLELVRGVRLAALVRLAAHRVEPLQEILAVVHLVVGHALGQFEVRQLERPRLGRVGLGLERLVRDAQVGASGAREHARDHHVGRHLGRRRGPSCFETPPRVRSTGECSRRGWARRCTR